MPFRDSSLRLRAVLSFIYRCFILFCNFLKRSGVSLSVTSLLLLSVAVYAADKSWTGGGDGTYWSDTQNWFPVGVPTSADDVMIDLNNAGVICGKTFEAKSITMGGANTSALTSNDFIYGTVVPSSGSDNALYIRKNGSITLKGPGTLTLKGKFKNSEEEGPPGEEAFMFTLE